MIRFPTLPVIAVLLLSACGSPPTQLPPTDLPPTSIPPTLTAEQIPTDPPPLTPTPVPAPSTDMPFRDDFDGALSDQVGWEWNNEAPDRWSISDEGWLVIDAENPPLRGGISNLLTRALPSEGDVIVTTLVRANAEENFKQAALFLFNEDLDYVSILIGFCEPCVPATQGYGTFLEAFMGDQSLLPEPVFIPRDPANTEVTLRLEYSPDAAVVVGLYAYTPGEWVSAGIVRDVPPLTMVGIGAANLPGPTGSSFDMTAEYDYVDLELP